MNWRSRLRDVVWTSVAAVALAFAAVVTAVADSTNISLTLALGLAGVVSALLGDRE
jgi:2-methylcitrate dehydratase PrpD